MYSILRDAKESRESLTLAVKAAEASVRIDGGKNAQTLLYLADGYLVSGDQPKAKEYAGKAIETASRESSTLREEIEKVARRLGLDR